MGTRMASGYANVFMGELENVLLEKAPGGRKPLFYGRFIDDIFGVWLFGKEAFLEFFKHANAHHDSIQFTHSLGQFVNFLDTTATLTGDHITADLYMKPTNTHQHLLPSSNHPPHVHKHLPYRLAIRL